MIVIDNGNGATWVVSLKKSVTLPDRAWIQNFAFLSGGHIQGQDIVVDGPEVLIGINADAGAYAMSIVPTSGSAQLGVDLVTTSFDGLDWSSNVYDARWRTIYAWGSGGYPLSMERTVPARTVAELANRLRVSSLFVNADVVDKDVSVNAFDPAKLVNAAGPNGPAAFGAAAAVYGAQTWPWTKLASQTYYNITYSRRFISPRAALLGIDLASSLLDRSAVSFREVMIEVVGGALGGMLQESVTSPYNKASSLAASAGPSTFISCDRRVASVPAVRSLVGGYSTVSAPVVEKAEVLSLDGSMPAPARLAFEQVASRVSNDAFNLTSTAYQEAFNVLIRVRTDIAGRRFRLAFTKKG